MPMHAKAITSCMHICPKDRGLGSARGRRYSVWAWYTRLLKRAHRLGIDLHHLFRSWTCGLSPRLFNEWTTLATLHQRSAVYPCKLAFEMPPETVELTRPFLLAVWKVEPFMPIMPVVFLCGGCVNRRRRCGCRDRLRAR